MAKYKLGMRKRKVAQAFESQRIDGILLGVLDKISQNYPNLRNEATETAQDTMKAMQKTHDEIKKLKESA